MNGFNALVLAGRRDSENPFAEVQGETHRALLDVVGVPMLVRVVHALRASSSVDRIEVSIDDSDAFEAVPELRKLETRGEITRHSSLSSPSRSVQDALNGPRSFRSVRRRIGCRRGRGSRGRIGASSHLPLDHPDLSAISRRWILGRQPLRVSIAASPSRCRILGASGGLSQATVAARARLRPDDLAALCTAPAQPRRNARTRISCDRLPNPRRASPVCRSRHRRRSAIGPRPCFGNPRGAR